MTLQPLQPQAGDILHRLLPAPGLGKALLTFHARHDVLKHRHIGKERVVLEQIAHAALLGFQVDLVLRVEHGLPVDAYHALVRRHNTGDTAQRHALSTAGITQQGQRLMPGFKLDIQLEGTDLFPDIHIN